MPDELAGARKKLEIHERGFQEGKQKECIAKRPNWSKVDFRRYIQDPRRESYFAMKVDDLKSILSPNQKAWVDEEKHLLHDTCGYPSAAPEGCSEVFVPFPILDLNLAEAIFEFDPSAIQERDVERYFGAEEDRVEAYNRERTELMSRARTLNNEIASWNTTSMANWEVYAGESGRLLREEIAQFVQASNLYRKECEEQKTRFSDIREGYKSANKGDLIKRFDYVLGNLRMPSSVPRVWDIDFQEEERILLVEIGLPDVVHNPPFKTVAQKSGLVGKPLNQKEKREIVPKVHPAILMRVAIEIFRNDDAGIVDLLALNGWITFDDPRTGLSTKAYTASLLVQRSQMVNINLEKLDPLAAFEALHGKSAGKLIEIIPIEPMLSLNKKDSRFVDAREVLSMLGNETNLASMDWQDFEHLIRELFEKEFSGRGAEVKITQASRDRGVDAIVFDPDPIHGGKYVIQAKRYSNTVDVSAVRDLCAVVKKEGASRGILVTTSSYGADAYAFANNEPITLLSGAELLGLLKKHGYGFRINLEEARKANQAHLYKEKGTAGS